MLPRGVQPFAQTDNLLDTAPPCDPQTGGAQVRIGADPLP